MSDHYYSKTPLSEKLTQTWDDCVLGHSFTFTSSSGVFSKGSIDFGSRVLIESFNAPKVEGDFLDLGCGYGVIGITLAKHYPNRSVMLVDVNERAVLLADKNAKRNNVKNIEILQSDGFSNVNDRNYAAIITNPPIRAGKDVVFHFYEESMKHLISGGELWVVIQKKQGAPSTMKYLESIFATVEIMNRKKGYFIIRAQKG